MTNQLIGVLLGAIIASIVPICTLVISTRKWKIEKRIEQLKEKHDRLESMYEDCLKKLLDGLTNNAYSSDFTSSLLVFGSAEAVRIFNEHIDTKNKTIKDAKTVYLNMAIAAKTHLKEISDEIDSLLA